MDGDEMSQDGGQGRSGGVGAGTDMIDVNSHDSFPDCPVEQGWRGRS